MENRVYYVSYKEMVGLKEELRKDVSLYIAEMDGNAIESIQDFLYKTSELFEFPTISRSIDSYLDWITDLDWLKKDGYVFIINNYAKFLSNDIQTKK